MKKELLRRIAVLTMAAAMIFTMTANVFAAGDEGRTTGDKTNTYTGSNKAEATTKLDLTNNTIPLTKSIVFSNLNSSNVYEPNITYTYTVAPASIEDSKYTVTDDQSVTAYVHPGVTGGVAGTSIQFGVTVGGTATTAVTTSAEGTEVERTANLAVDLSKFSRPGIYRYKISETSNPTAVTAAGLTARTSDYNADRYLDVYIRNATTGSGLEMYGAVIYASTTDGKDDITTTTSKTTGYEPSATSGDPKDDKTVDQYVTYDFSVKKAITGTMADKNHEFPFYVTVSNTITGAKYTYIDDPGTGEGVAETISDAAIVKGTDAKSSVLKLKDGELIKFVGVPSNQTNELAVVAKEFNDTADSYTPSAAAVKGTAEMTAGTAMAANDGYDSLKSFTVKTNDVANQIITITNNLDSISPTNVVVRFAPYLFIIAAAAMLLLLKSRRNKEEE